MVRYKYIDTQPRFLAVDLAKQLLPGTFEHAVHHLVEHELDLSGFDARFRRSIRSGSCSVWCTTSRSSRITVRHAGGVTEPRGGRGPLYDDGARQQGHCGICQGTERHFLRHAHPSTPVAAPKRVILQRQRPSWAAGEFTKASGASPPQFARLLQRTLCGAGP
ncbi:hypothetical protein BH09GEM1_BH09GEM1_39310 [soil metagenome]